MIDLEAYAADCRVHGRFELYSGRMSDELDLVRELFIREARLKSLDDGHEVALPELFIERDELCAVVATGNRGDPTRRRRTHTVRVEIEIGPYRVRGVAHGATACEPLRLFLGRPAWVPLTEATVAYRAGHDEMFEEMATLLVNRHLMRSLRALEA